MPQEVRGWVAPLHFQGNTQGLAPSGFQSEEAEFREAESPVHGHTVRKWQSPSLTPGGMGPKARVVSITFYKANKFY